MHLFSLFLECAAEADVIFVVDASNWVGRRFFHHAVKFVKSITERLEYASQKFRVGMVTYGARAKVQMRMYEGVNKSNVIHAAQTLHFHGGEPYVTEALETVNRDVLKTSEGDRPEVPNVVVLLTSGLTDKEDYIEEVSAGT